MKREFQRLPVLSQQARIGVHILQLPLLDLRDYLQQELIENPILEEDERAERERDQAERTPEEPEESGYDYGEVQQRDVYDSEKEKRQRYRETLITQKETLEDHLIWQLSMFLDGVEYEIGEYIIRSLDENGYLTVSTGDIAEKFQITEEEVKNVLKVIQEFDPVGIAARNLQECILIQLKAQGKEDMPCYKIVSSYFDELINKEYGKISKELGLSEEKTERAHAYITSLEPKPGRTYLEEETVRIVPDIILKEKDGEYFIELNDSYLPILKTSSYYSRLLKNKTTDDTTKDYIMDRQNRAKWLIEAIYQRRENIKKIAEYLVDYQRRFLDNGPAYIRPLKMTDIARKLDVSESTVSRIVANKYIQTDHGMLLLRAFLSGSVKQSSGEEIATGSIKNRIKELVNSENKESPLSDQKIVEILKEEGTDVSRRVVSKYRYQLKILPSNLRKLI